jgi:hypothetical protein
VTCYLISPADGPEGRMDVLRFVDRAAASVAASRNQCVVEGEADVLWTGPTLVDVYNAVTGLRVGKFESNEVGRRRLLTQLDRYARDGEPSDGTPEPKAKRGRAAKFADSDVIRLLVKNNPKKKGSAAYNLFELYEDGMTCEQFLNAGGTRACFSWDTIHGFINIEKIT